MLGTDARANTVTVGPKAALATSTVRIRGLRMHAAEGEVDAVKLRYHSPAIAATLAGDTVALDTPVHGVAPGQIACFLRGDVVVGCGTIVG